MALSVTRLLRVRPLPLHSFFPSSDPDPPSSAGIALVFPDTSPRGAGIEGEDKDWDFGVFASRSLLHSYTDPFPSRRAGTGAGFYLNATAEPYKKHYNMYKFITEELPSFLSSLPIDTSRSSIFGHSMGGHVRLFPSPSFSSTTDPLRLSQGALTLYLKNLSSSLYLSASAFAPITNPTQCPWGEKAFKGYLAGGVDEGKQYDATELLKEAKGKDVKILVDVGTGDQFYKDKQRAFFFFSRFILQRCSFPEADGAAVLTIDCSPSRKLHRGSRRRRLLVEAGRGQPPRELRPLVRFFSTLTATILHILAALSFPASADN